jgi:hypothetical protein
MELNLEEGTIEFVIRKNKLKLNDGVFHNLFSYANDLGKISITKTKSNFLIFLHQFGKIKTKAKVDVSKLEDKDHHIAATWSIKDEKIVLYVDGVKVAEEKMKF